MKKLNKLYIGTNTKMYKNIKDTKAFINELKDLTAKFKDEKIQMFVIPSYTTLESACQITNNSHIKLGAQNMCYANEGQFTGEISPDMLKEVGVSIIEIGHSERRHILGETDFDAELKVKSAADNNFIPLLCIGETKEQRQYEISDEVLRTQIKIALNKVSKEQAKNIWIAYEPVWAIGVNGIPAEPTYVGERHLAIRKVLVELFDEVGQEMPILYGGSVNNENSKEFIVLPEVDGLFIGRSAWNAKNFNEIINDVYKLYCDK